MPKVFAIIIAALLISNTFYCCTDIDLSLSGTAVANNNYVNVDDIGVNECALLCRTNNDSCCDGANDKKRTGEWYFPNGTRVEVRPKTQDEFYRNRRHQVVRQSQSSTWHIYGKRAFPM